MSRLIDKLKMVEKGSVSGMGFRTAAVARGPSLLLIPRLSGLDAKSGAAVAEGGADAVLIGVGEALEKGKVRKSRVKALGGVPWGVWWEDLGVEDMKVLGEGGGDFIVIEAAKTPAAVLSVEGPGRVLVIEPSLADGLLRAVDLMSVDAVLLRGGLENQSALTVEHLMTTQRASAFVRKPLLVEVSPKIEREDLKALVEVGVKGVVVALAPQGMAAGLKRLRRAIDEVPAPRRSGATVALPRVEVREEPEDEDE
ncbi:MAG: hypothetical protein V3S82_09525 [Dehalococcoidia bacterium]